MKVTLRAIRCLTRISLIQTLAEENLLNSGGLTDGCLRAISEMVFSRVSAALKVLMDPSWNAEIGMMANLSP